jgi:hypothetical protein
MKPLKSALLMFLFSYLTIFIYPIEAQLYNPHGFDCIIPGTPPNSAPSVIGGLYKPEGIADYTTEPSAYFPVLVVYVQFKNDPGEDVSWWPQDILNVPQPPEFMGDVIATVKATNFGSNWWDAYSSSTETLSDYWMEVSRGKLHLVGREVHVVLPEEVSYYESFTDGSGRARVMEDLFTALASEIGSDWPLFDKWAKVNGNFVYGDGDGFVDMMYIVARSNPCSDYHPGVGYFRPYGVRDNCTHGSDHTVYNSGGVEIKVRGSFDENGSGFQISPGGCGNGVLYAPMPKWATISFSEHEHGHYFFGSGAFWEYHQTYAKVNNYWGPEEYLSPYELMRLGYNEPAVVDFGEPENYIDDWTSRSAGSQMLKVPIGSSSRNEFFIIANRQKVSDYDRIMWGDTCHGNPYFNLGSQSGYGKGVYIYHAYPGEVGSGYPWGIHIDQECADGLWNWEHTGNDAPDWEPNNPWLPVFSKVEPVFDLNDNSGEGYWNMLSMDNRDGKNVSKYVSGFNHVKWFSTGKKAAQQYGTGTDRIFTNAEENWTSREMQGDRWDAWDIGYNEVFSPYSSPSTVDWDDENTGIFIYFESKNGTVIKVNVYKSGEGGYTEEDILAATPPSKPMLYRPVTVYNCNGTSGNPRITWDNNLEPDMNRSSLSGPFKRYKIYRAFSSNSNTAPLTYTYLDTYDDYTPNDTANYIDNNSYNGVVIACGIGGTPGGDYWRYKITAVDKEDDESVKSDFVSTRGDWISEPDIIPGNDNEKPKYFNLSQNYPNPFNPSTSISFSLPQNTFVTIKVFNALGQEVAVLINNEYKDAGSYSALFDGTNFASGIYFYSIKAGTYKDIKKMVLIK